MSVSTPFDLIVVGATAPGVVSAVRAAREGLRVLLVATGTELGGSLPSLGALETHFRGQRSPLVDEFGAAIVAYYKENYGEESEAYRVCTGGNMITFEPKVATRLIEAWVAAEANLGVWRGWAPEAVERSGRRVEAVTLRSAARGELRRVEARAFIEAGYEGDLMARAGVSHRIGREARSEFGEPRAGRVFTRWLTGVYPREAADGRLKLVTAGATTSEPLPGSTGEGDDNVQSYSYRLCVTDDPGNRLVLETPPEGYDRAAFAPILLPPVEKARLKLPFHHRFLIYSLREMVERDHLFHGHALPGRKRSWNATNLTGGGKGYATGSRETRTMIAAAHRRHALGLMWFLQNDPDMPTDLREKARAWGLARDEFVETQHFPAQLYVREARRLVGRTVFTEHDALLAPREQRAPVHADSIGITEFSLDSLACTTDRRGDSLCDGQLFQMEVSRPGQVPFGVMLPADLDNLLVVTTVSATHVGWGTVRQTPTLMHLAESAAWAVVLAQRAGVEPAEVDVAELQRTLAERGGMLTFYNDVPVAAGSVESAAWQVLGCLGFSDSYEARPDDLLTPAEACVWAAAAAKVGLTLNPRQSEGQRRGDVVRSCYLSMRSAKTVHSELSL